MSEGEHPPTDWLAQPAEIFEREDMRRSENTAEMVVSACHVDIHLAAHLDVDRKAWALAVCLRALAEPEREKWAHKGATWRLAFIVDGAVAGSLLEQVAWRIDLLVPGDAEGPADSD